MFILLMLLAIISALTAVHVVEFWWLNRPPFYGTQSWPKGRAMRFVWAGMAVLTMFGGQFPLGIMLAIAGLPVCLAHLRLVDQDPAKRIGVMDVVGRLTQNARESFRRIADRTRISPRR